MEPFIVETPPPAKPIRSRFLADSVPDDQVCGQCGYKRLSGNVCTICQRLTIANSEGGKALSKIVRTAKSLGALIRLYLEEHTHSGCKCLHCEFLADEKQNTVGDSYAEDLTVLAHVCEWSSSIILGDIESVLLPDE